jgi:hypothetical protein
MLVVFVLPTICLSQESVAECDAMMLKLNKQISALNLNKAVGITRRIRAGQFQLPYVFPAA